MRNAYKQQSKQKQKQNGVGQLIIYGRHAVISALKNPLRRVNKLLITLDTKDEIKKDFPQSPYNIVDKNDINKVLPDNAVHQGFALYCSRLESYTLEEILDLSDKKTDCHILILDQVTDPQNIGAIIRSCVAFDTLALIVQDKHSPLESGAMDKAAAGTIEKLPIARVTNISHTIDILKDNGFWVMGMDGYADITIDKVKKNGKMAIVMGSEGKGMRRLVQENCDASVKLPINLEVESLNVATAAAVALYELNRK